MGKKKRSGKEEFIGWLLIFAIICVIIMIFGFLASLGGGRSDGYGPGGRYGENTDHIQHLLIS